MIYCHFCKKHFDSDDMYPDVDDPAYCPDCKAPHFWEEGYVPLLTDDELQLILEKRINEEYQEYLYRFFKKYPGIRH